MTNWAVQQISIVSLCLQDCTPIFALTGNDDFWSCHTGFRPDMLPKNGNFEGVFLDISARSSRIPELFGPAYALLCHGKCFQVSSLICRGSRASTLLIGSFLLFLAGSARMVYDGVL